MFSCLVCTFLTITKLHRFDVERAGPMTQPNVKESAHGSLGSNSEIT